jgi:hypothetical protein
MPDFIAKKKLFVCEKAKSNRTEVYAEPVEAKSNRAELKGETFAKISSVVALQARYDKRKSESLGGKSNRAEVKTNRAETEHLCAIKKNLYAIRKNLCALSKSFCAIRKIIHAVLPFPFLLPPLQEVSTSSFLINGRMTAFYILLFA